MGTGVNASGQDTGCQFVLHVSAGSIDAIIASASAHGMT
jgi:hypothetical protein